jgi:hypothetical protein
VAVSDKGTPACSGPGAAQFRPALFVSLAGKVVHGLATLVDARLPGIDADPFDWLQTGRRR